MADLRLRFAAGLHVGACFFAFACVAAPLAIAAGGGGGGGGSTGYSSGDSPPGQKAIAEYKTGEKRLDRARELQQEAAEARAKGDAKRVAKLEKKAAGMYGRAEKYYRKALKYDEGLYQAWSSLGYTLRHLDRWDEALAAYDRALELEPRYAEAVEYRAEAYLELGRLDEAKQGYVQLVGWIRPLADRLMAKMETFAEARAIDPAGLDPEAIIAFATWIEERKQQDGPFDPISDVERATW